MLAYIIIKSSKILVRYTYSMIFIILQENSYLFRTSLYLAASASAEFFADIALAPMEAIKVRIQTQPGWANTLREGLPKLYSEEGIRGYALNYAFLKILCTIIISIVRTQGWLDFFKVFDCLLCLYLSFITDFAPLFSFCIIKTTNAFCKRLPPLLFELTASSLLFAWVANGLCFCDGIHNKNYQDRL